MLTRRDAAIAEAAATPPAYNAARCAPISSYSLCSVTNAHPAASNRWRWAGVGGDADLAKLFWTTADRFHQQCKAVNPTENFSERMSGGLSRAAALGLYRRLMKASKKFSNYNFREYALRRTREDFRKFQHESNPAAVDSLWKKALENAELLERQALIQSLYARQQSILELKRAAGTTR